MYVVPLKWLPWILLVGGIVWLVSGDADSATAIVPILIGGGWLFIKYYLKKNNTSNNTTVSSTTKAQTPSIINDTKKCPKCGAEMKKEKIYCSNCGNKLD